MSNPILTSCIATLLIVIAGNTAAVDLEVITTVPAPNTQMLAQIHVDFDRPVNPATITSSSFRVFGRWSGTMSGTFSFANGNERVFFVHSEPFSGGEAIYVNLSRDILAADDGSPLRVGGYTFQFYQGVIPTPLVFEQVDVMSNRTGGAGGPQTRLYGATASDLNNDSYLDLTTVNEVSGDVRVFMNKADGSGEFNSFLTPQGIGSVASPNEPADFNNDGNPDLCVSASASNDVWILLGVGDGTFGTPQSITVGSTPLGIVRLDVDGDGDMDIVNANNGSNNLSLMINDGSGVFGTASFFEGGVNGEYGLAAGDMNNDGIADLVVGGRNGQQIITLLGNGDGTFTAAGPAQTSGGATWVIAIDDVNGDGNLDASTANSFSNNGSILLGNGDGTFGAPVTTAPGGFMTSTDLGDLDGDGDKDWILSSFGGGHWRLYVNDGAGAFTFDQEFTALDNPSCAVMYDADNDGDLDLALTDEISDVVVLMENRPHPSGIADIPSSALTVLPNFPNPFTTGTQIRFRLDQEAAAEIDVFDIAGHRVATAVLPKSAPGLRTFFFDGRSALGEDLPSGVYFYRISVNNLARTQKMVLMR